ncbi:MAG: permease [Bacillota bacterium]
MRDKTREVSVNEPDSRRFVQGFVFAFIGYILNGLIPAAWMTKLFGSGHIYGVPLAAILGLPLYINTEASLPLARSLVDLGMSPGALLAFLITGAGTSIGAIAGAGTIAKWRVVGIVVGTLLIGSIILGYAYNGIHALGWL